MSTARQDPPARLPVVLRRLCDDAAIFPPGLASLSEAVAAHLRYRRSWFAALVGPLVLAPGALADLGAHLPGGSSPARIGAAAPAAGDHDAGPAVRPSVSVTLSGGPDQLAEVLATAHRLPVVLQAVEVAVPAGLSPAELLDRVDSAVADLPGGQPEVYVEIPRERRREGLLAALAGSPYRAKFRTGGVRAELYPDEAELAASLSAAVAAGLPFKATAGLHHAVRNTDPETGFEQHGFLNLLLAVDALRHGGGEADARALLAERDSPTVAGLVSGLGADRAAAARASFVSFGTCSITDPLTELVELGLLAAPITEGARA